MAGLIFGRPAGRPIRRNFDEKIPCKLSLRSYAAPALRMLQQKNAAFFLRHFPFFNKPFFREFIDFFNTRQLMQFGKVCRFSFALFRTAVRITLCLVQVLLQQRARQFLKKAFFPRQRQRLDHFHIFPYVLTDSLIKFKTCFLLVIAYRNHSVYISKQAI